ncbi:MAG TPA: hypothetical protein VJ824_12900 [Bacillota bacterium]|nr:hypothetical protein [Bacillota bacterium]
MNLFDPVIIHKFSYLPDKLTELSYKDEKAALEILRDWGEGRKDIEKLWDAVISGLENKSA